MASSPPTEGRPAALLVCHAGATLGLGHLTRMLALSRALSRSGLPSRLLVQGDEIDRDDLAAIDHSFVGLDADLFAAVDEDVATIEAGVVVLDLHPRLVPEGFAAAASRWREAGARVIGVDALLPQCDSLDVTWVPSLLVDADSLERCREVHHGWDSLLISKRLPTPDWSPGPNLLVVTGGSDVTHQHETLPSLIDASLPATTRVTWVQGPFAGEPAVPSGPRLSWEVVAAPSGLDSLIVAADYALTVFGVTVFELLQYGIPTVVFSPYADRRIPELDEVAVAGAAVVAPDAPDAVAAVAALMSDEARAAGLSTVARSLSAVNGADRLAHLIHSIVE